MDWRHRRYYTVRFPSNEYNRYKNYIKEAVGVKLHPATYPPAERGSENFRYSVFARSFKEESKPRGYYHFLVSVPRNYAVNNLMYLFNFMCRECAENGWIFKWEEIVQRGKK